MNVKRIMALILMLTMCLSISNAAFADGEIADEPAEQVEDVVLTELPEEEPPVAEEPAAEEPAEEEPAEEEPVAEQPAAEEPVVEDLRVRVRFACNPVDAKITVYAAVESEEGYVPAPDENGEPLVIEAEEDGTYLLLPGVYLYDAECEGYTSVLKATLTVA